jgi:hypothetical protein
MCQKSYTKVTLVSTTQRVSIRLEFAFSKNHPEFLVQLWLRKNLISLGRHGKQNAFSPFSLLYRNSYILFYLTRT